MLLAKDGSRLAQGASPDELVASMAWACRVRDDVKINVPRVWELMKRWGWKLINIS
jgi:hypothetical protein